MKISKSSLQNISIVVLVLIVVIAISATAFAGGLGSGVENTNTDTISELDGKQLITVSAKNGYFPGVIEAKAGLETILRISTNSTFDCSASLNITKIGVKKNLPATGNTDFEIEAQAKGSEIEGLCSMGGMYGFKIRFI